MKACCIRYKCSSKQIKVPCKYFELSFSCKPKSIGQPTIDPVAMIQAKLLSYSTADLSRPVPQTVYNN